MAGEPGGTLQGKEKVAEYWKGALQKLPNLKFEIVDVLFSINSIVIYYKSVLGKMSTELLLFGNDGKVIKSIAHYDNP